MGVGGVARGRGEASGVRDLGSTVHPGDNPGANRCFFLPNFVLMPPPGGSICGRLTSDLPPGCLKCGRGEEDAFVCRSPSQPC